MNKFTILIKYHNKLWSFAINTVIVENLGNTKSHFANLTTPTLCKKYYFGTDKITALINASFSYMLTNELPILVYTKHMHNWTVLARLFSKN